MTLGEWLNQMIMDDGDEAPAPESLRRAAPPPSTPAAPTYASPPRADRLEVGPAPADDLERMLANLERLTARIENTEHRSTLAISGIDQSVLGVLARMETAEREQAQVAARFEGALDEVRTDQARATERLRRIEQEATGPRSAEAMRALESALNKVAGQLYEGENRTREAIGVLRRDMDQLSLKASAADVGSQALVDAVVARMNERLDRVEAGASDAARSLEASFVSLDGRLKAAEAQAGQPSADPRLEERLEQLTGELSRKIEQTRLEMSEQIKASAHDHAERFKASADGLVDKLDRNLRDVAAHVQASERKSAQAIEKIGQEVLHMADSFNQKVQASESRNAEAVDQIGAEMQRVASAVEQKLRRADTSQAEALEKLGTEIARITERLAERIAGAERRSALAVDDVGEQIARVTDRINQRHERAASELTDRMRQSEERTARLLEEARERIDRRLGETQRSVVEPSAAPVAAATSPLSTPAARSPAVSIPATQVQAPTPSVSADPFAGTPFAEGYDAFAQVPFPENGFGAPAENHSISGYAAEAYSPPSASAPDSFAAPDSYPPPGGFGDYDAGFPSEPDLPAFAAEDFDAAQAYGHAPAAYDLGASEPPEPGPPTAHFDSASTRSASTRELIAAARAAARQASQPPEKEAKAPKEPMSGGPFKFGKKKDSNGVRNALLASGAVAILGVSAASYVLSRPDVVAGWTKGDSKTAGMTGQSQSQGGQGAPPASSEALAANLTADAPAASAGDGQEAAASAPTPGADESELYNQAKDKLKANDKAGLDMMRKAAGDGYAPAQFYLAKMYEDGEAGVKKDPEEARRWTQRAAAGGDPKAMHNLGLYYFHGDGGGKNVSVAATWFRRAADLGLVDSQYNLAQLYEQGLGVSQNPAEAYKWFLIAAKSGDGESKASAQRLKSQLSASAQQAAERAAAAFRAESAAPVQTAVAGSAPGAVAPAPSIANDPNLSLAQKALSKLGYYKGPDDGANSPALKLAIASYQKTLGEPADGSLTPDLIAKFNAITSRSGSPG